MCNVLTFVEPRLGQHVANGLDGGMGETSGKNVGVDGILQEKLDEIGAKVGMLDEVVGFLRTSSSGLTNDSSSSTNNFKNFLNLPGDTRFGVTM